MLERQKYRTFAISEIITPRQIAAQVETRFSALSHQYLQQGVARDMRVRFWGLSSPSPHLAIAIPACNEESEIGFTLSHIAASLAASGKRCAIVVFANNCVDRTSEAVQAAAGSCGVDLLLIQGTLAPPFAHAGWARRIAMDAACSLVNPCGSVLTTDADTRVPLNWVEHLSAMLGQRHDLVCGSLGFNVPQEVWNSPAARRLIHVERTYSALQDHVRHRCDQLVGRQPLHGTRPHYTEAGAGIGITSAFYRRIGRLPPVRWSEDRALIRRAELFGARIGYPEISADTSSRFTGRAQGGLADTLVRWITSSNPVADQRIRTVANIGTMWRNALAVASPALRQCDVQFQMNAGSDPAEPFAASRELSGIRYAMMENEWVRSLTRQRLVAQDLEAGVGQLTEFIANQVEPVFSTWRAHWR